MKILYYECFAGLSGDMNLGAMVDLGVDIDFLRQSLSKLNIDNEFEISSSRKSKMGISGTKVDVVLKNAHTHDHQSNSHGKHSHTQEQKSHTHCNSRNYNDIAKLIDESDLNSNIRRLSKEMFLKVAVAEGKVHDKPFEDVHFHEVGATDSIIDIVGAAICFDHLGIDKVISSTIQVGSGFVTCAHGKMPVPAPATALILEGFKIAKGGVKGESTTPTGAAILATLCDSYNDDITLVTEKVGYGVGNKDFEIPNVLRVSIGQIDDETSLDYDIENQFLIETNIDDMSGEYLPIVEKALFDLGALDVYKSPIMMKKGRSALMLSALCSKKDKDAICDYIFKKTTTLGVRISSIEKRMMKRKFVEIETIYGVVRVKEGLHGGKVVKHKPEFETLKELALKHSVDIELVRLEAEDEYRKSR